MKTITIISLLFIIGLQATAQSKLDQFLWLEGCWTRTNAKPGRSGSECWKVSGTEWHGSGITMNGTDTTLIERIRLVVKDNELYYVADVPENKQSIYFKIIEIKPFSFTCENHHHDFPKRITYTRTGDTLKATISGDGKSIDYLFTKK